MALVTVGACSQFGSKQTIEEDPKITCGDLSIGQTKTESCEGGSKVFVCRDDGLSEILNTCKPTNPAECVSFEDIKPILTEECVLCHFTPEPYDRYEFAKAKIDSFIRRINLGSDNPERMPREPKPALEGDDKRLIEAWRQDGLKEKDSDCVDTGGPNTGFIDLLKLESAIILDLAKLEGDDRLNTRYLVGAHKLNQKIDDQITMAINKSTNSVSNDEDLAKAEEVFPGLYRIDLRSYGFDADDWQDLEEADKFDLESFTDEGQQIKFLTGARKAWFHYDNFIEISQNAAIYYDLINVPNNLGQLLRNLGVNVGAQFKDFSAQFLGFNGSEITLQKNRLIVRFEGEDGYVWITFDPLALNGIRERNLFEFPCLNGTGCDALFNFAASEVIWTMPNGLQGYALFNAQGQRQDNAPIEDGLVQDTRSPIDPQIDNAIDCNRCHAKGIIPATDEIRGHVLNNGTLFRAEDRQIILELYKSLEANNAIFASDNSVFSGAMGTLGVDQTRDQITAAWDELRLDWDLVEVSSFLFLTPEQFSQGLRGSGQGAQAIGQLLSGGRITFDQFIDILPVLKNDLRLFKEPL